MNKLNENGSWIIRHKVTKEVIESFRNRVTANEWFSKKTVFLFKEDYEIVNNPEKQSIQSSKRTSCNYNKVVG